MNIKKIIKRCLPRSCTYRREYWLQAKNASKTYAEVEREIDARFEEAFGRKIDWDNPVTYNEKINVAKLYGENSIKTRLTDKIRVVDWVKGRVGNECEFIPLLGKYNSVNEIDFVKLPERFVMKMNNDSGSVFIRDEEHPVTRDVFLRYKYFFQKRNYMCSSYEMQYKDIKPKIMIEKYMGGEIRDYKFQCFDGKVAYCQVDFGRFSGEHARNFYDRKWQILPFNKGYLENIADEIKKPRNFNKMWRLAEKLSSGFDQVRVDFYDIDGDVYFGEMTFTSASGFSPYTDPEIDVRMGNLWKLDMEPIRRRRKKLLEDGAKIGD